MAVTGGCNNCVKYLLFLFNFAFLCLGVGILVVGLWLRFDHRNDIYVEEIREDNTAIDYYYVGTYITMATGCIVMGVGFLGCCGAMQESICMLVFYFIALLCIFGLEIAGCMWCYLNREQVGAKVTEQFREKIIKNRYKENDIAAQKAVDLMQEKFKCCGIDSYMDWFDSGQVIPDSCGCNTTEGKSVCSERGFYLNGCGKEIEEEVISNIYILAGIGVGISFIEILGMMFAVILCCAIFKGFEDDEYRSLTAIRPFAKRKNDKQNQMTEHETSFGIGIFRD